MLLVCEYPGCVAFAVDGRRCPVHQRPAGAVLCERCAGTGRFAGPPPLPCAHCGGTGLADRTRHGSKFGTDRRRDTVDTRGLIRGAEQAE